MSAVEHTQRLTVSEVARRLLERPEHQPAPPESSVSISRNARGAAQFEVTVRGEDPDACEAAARMIYDDLVSRYPYPSTNGAE
jgi:hypothetical protein